MAEIALDVQTTQAKTADSRNRQALRALVILLQKEDDLLDYVSVFLLIHGTDTGADTLVHVVFETGTLVRAGDRFGTGAEGEYPLQCLEGLTHRTGAGKRPEVATAVFLQVACEVYPRPLLVQRDLEVGKGLIVLQADVVRRVMLLYQVQVISALTCF